MTINPRDYDLDELREMARKGEPSAMPDEESQDVGWGPIDEEGADEPLAGGSFRAGLYRELLPLEAATDGLGKPYLESMPEEFAAEFVVFEWLEFLLMNTGFKGATEALDYYQSADWITEDVESTLNDYLLGIDNAGSGDATDLDMDDHMLSLVYVAKLASMA